MEKSQIIENNKLIAEFMGVQVNLGIYGMVGIKDEQLLGCIRYHYSWDWLMPVVERIEKSLPDDYVIMILHNDCVITVPEGHLNSEGFDIVGHGETKIEAVYDAAIEFIKWYNQNKAI